MKEIERRKKRGVEVVEAQIGGSKYTPKKEEREKRRRNRG